MSEKDNINRVAEETAANVLSGELNDKSNKLQSKISLRHQLTTTAIEAAVKGSDAIAAITKWLLVTIAPPEEYSRKWLNRRAREMDSRVSDLRMTYRRNKHGELEDMTINKPDLWKLYYRTEIRQNPGLRCMCCNNEFDFNDGICTGCGNVMLALVPGTIRIGQLVIKEKPLSEIES